MELLTDLLILMDSTLRTATPLVLAALAGLVMERAGIVDIGLEGKMLGAAFAAGAVAALSGSAFVGLFAAIFFSVLLAVLHGYVSINQHGNQIVSGMAINILVAGFAPTLAVHLFHKGGQTPLLPDSARFGPIDLPLAEALSGVPVIGQIYGDVLSGHNLITYLALAAVPLVGWLLYRTHFGLRLRAAGENPEALDSAGRSVAAIRYQAVILGGILCGFAGAVLSTGFASSFIRDMSAGKGFLALAAMIFGKWKPVPTLFACLLFGFVDALQGRLQGADIPGIGVVPVQFIQMSPYILTVILLAGFVGRIEAPKASGKPFRKDG